MKSWANKQPQQQHQQQQQQQPRQHRYSKEFLLKVKDERAAFIAANICPDIFKAYCYCMTGKHWDPEKYFDIVQNLANPLFSEKPAAVRNKPRPNFVQPKRNFTANNNNTKPYNRANNQYQQQHQQNIQKSTDMDKALLNLLKKNDKPANNTSPATVPVTAAASLQKQDGVALMEILNKKHTNIINDLFSSSNNNINANNYSVSHQPSSTIIHHPMILTAQELEFSQLYSQNSSSMVAAKTRTPDRPVAGGNMNARLNNSLDSSPGSSVNSSSSSCSRHSSSSLGNVVNCEDMDNASDAYKQLVKNLSNHPLSSAPHVAAQYSSLDDMLIKFKDENRNSSSQRTMEETEKLLKQLLHVDSKKRSASGAGQQKPRKKSSNKANGGKPNGADKQMDTLMSKLNNQQQPSSKVPKVNEQDHFSSLMNKLMPTLAAHVSTEVNRSEQQMITQDQNNILKWFPKELTN
jgi:hypothetical protein